MRSIISGFVLLGMGIGLGPVSKSTTARPFRSGEAQTAATQITVGESIHIESVELNEVRTVQVYLPQNYSRSRQKYPVIYVLDGEVIGPVTATAAQFLTDAVAIPQMPEAIVVAVINTNRNRDMPVPTEYGKRSEAYFLSFLANELIRVIEKEYRTEPLRILVGHSQGGLFAHYAMTARPEVFQWYLSLDAPLSGFPAVGSIMEKATKQVTKVPTFRGRLVTVESVYGWKKEWPATGWSKGSYGRQIALPDETHETMPYRGIYEGLRSLFHDYAPKLKRDTKGIYTLPAFEQMYQELSRAYGYSVAIPQSLLFQTARENTAMNYGAEAVELVKRAVSLYGESTTANQLMASAVEAAKRGRDPRLEAWAKLPPPDIGSMKPFLGTWESITPDGARLRVSFTENKGAVGVTYTIAPPAGDPFQMDVQFVQVIDSKTVQWGVRNGRGTGVIFYSAKLIDGKVLRGMVEPVGIEHAPPPHEVTFKRLN